MTKEEQIKEWEKRGYRAAKVGELTAEQIAAQSSAKKELIAAFKRGMAKGLVDIKRGTYHDYF